MVASKEGAETPEELRANGRPILLAHAGILRPEAPALPDRAQRRLRARLMDPPRMTTAEEVARIFNLLHDGSIEEAEARGGALRLKVAIPYLAESADPGCAFFILELAACSDLTFTAWVSGREENREITDLAEIFAEDLEIMESSASATGVKVVCLTDATRRGTCGGVLTFSCAAARVFDPRHNEVGLAKLESLARRYWDAFPSQSSRE